MQRDEIILTPEQRQQLAELSEQYLVASNEFAASESKKKSLNLVIKSMLDSFGVSKFTSDSGISITMSTRQNIKWDEDKLLQFCKTLGIDGLIKTKEYVDMEVLESALYHGTVKPEQLKPFQHVSPDIVTLRCTQKKILTE